jgi:Fe-S cluster assembly protein SufD
MNAPLRESLEYYLAEFARLSAALPGYRHDWVRQAREEAIRRFAELGFPTQRNEDWKYTSVAAIEKGRFSPTPVTSGTVTTAEVEAHAMPSAHLLVFVNGRLEPGLCRLGRLPGGVTLCGLAELLEDEPAGLERLLVDSRTGSAVAALNQAFMADGAYLRLAPGTSVEKPIQLLYIATSDNLAIQPRNLILAMEGSSVRVVEQHVAADGGTYLTNAVTDLVLGQGAAVEHHKLQNESPKAFHIATIRARLAVQSRFMSTSFAFGGLLARVGIDVELEGEGASSQLEGLYLADGRQHIDHHTCIDHRQPRGTSRESYKGVLGGAGRAVFNGRVIVRPDAQHSDAQQTNRNLLLSDKAEVDTKPQLEIWADDVKCGHGATVGQLDEDQVFYLRSRGIDDTAARTMLTFAFAREVVDRVSLPELQEKLDELLHERLPQL